MLNFFTGDDRRITSSLKLPNSKYKINVMKIRHKHNVIVVTDCESSMKEQLKYVLRDSDFNHNGMEVTTPIRRNAGKLDIVIEDGNICRASTYVLLRSHSDSPITVFRRKWKKNGCIFYKDDGDNILVKLATDQGSDWLCLKSNLGQSYFLGMSELLVEKYNAMSKEHMAKELQHYEGKVHFDGS